MEKKKASMFDNIRVPLEDLTEEEERENRLQKAVLDIKDKYGKNAVLKGMNLQKGATTKERNLQIGGHKSGEA